jgi:hypothetical protein
MEDAMPKWLIAALSWGGAALAVLSAAALILIKVMAPTPTAEAMPEPSGAPVAFYWIALFVGVVATAVGFVVGRRKN